MTAAIEPLGVFTGTKTGVAFVLLLALNLLNYVDRYLLAGAQPVLQRAIHASDSRMGGLSSSFFAVYMFAAPLVGWLGDRLPRRVLVCTAVLWWSIALGAATLGGSFHWFLGSYMMLGVGEAAFGVYAIAMLSDYYPGANRSKAFSLYLLAMTTGRALGYPVGGGLAGSFGWRAPFQVMALVGILFSVLAWRFLIDTETLGPQQPAIGEKSTASQTSLRALLSPSYICAVLALAMENFAAGGLSVWLPTYLYRFQGYTVAGATAMLGIITLICGIGGTWAGGVLGERLVRRDRRALYWISAGCFLLAIPSLVAVLNHNPRLIQIGVIVLETCLLLNLGPLNTAVLNSVPTSVRATAIAVALFLIHALGDAISPQLIGRMSDKYGLRAGLLVTLAALVIGVVLLVVGAQTLPHDEYGSEAT